MCAPIEIERLSISSFPVGVSPLRVSDRTNAAWGVASNIGLCPHMQNHQLNWWFWLRIYSAPYLSGLDFRTESGKTVEYSVPSGKKGENQWKLSKQPCRRGLVAATYRICTHCMQTPFEAPCRFSKGRWILSGSFINQRAKDRYWIPPFSRSSLTMAFPFYKISLKKHEKTDAVQKMFTI